MRVTLVDGSNLARRNYHAQNLTTFTGIRTGCVYGTINSLLSLQGQHPAEKVIVVWDAEGGSAFRKALFPAYKGQRGETDPEYIEDRANLEQLLGVMGVTQVTQPGIECDDIIGYLAKEHFPADEVTIVSNDKDFYQLIDQRIRVWSPHTNEFVPIINGKIGIKDGTKTIYIRPDQVADYKALAGDKSDNIPGAIGFGVGAAITFFETNESIDPLFEGKANISQLRSSALTGLMQSIPFLKTFKELATINLLAGKVAIPDRPAIRYDMTEALFEHYEFKQFAAMGKRVYVIGGVPWA